MKMSTRTLVSALAIVAVSQACFANLLQNGDFSVSGSPAWNWYQSETNYPDNTTWEGHWGWPGSVSPADGRHLHLTITQDPANTACTELRQSGISVEAGKAYVFEIDTLRNGYAGLRGSDKVKLGVSIDGSNWFWSSSFDEYNTFTSWNTWEHLTFSLASPVDGVACVALRVENGTNASNTVDMFFDNASVTEVPEPATLLLLLGTGSLWLTRRKK